MFDMARCNGSGCAIRWDCYRYTLRRGWLKVSIIPEAFDGVGCEYQVPNPEYYTADVDMDAHDGGDD